MKQKYKKKYIIVGLCAILLVMAVGYASFASNLTINGTSEITSNWSIEITNISTIIPTGSGAQDVNSICDESGTPKQCGDKLTATVSATLVSPGDSITYRIKVANKGSLNAVLNHITLNANESNYVGYYINKDKTNTKIKDTGYRLLEENGILNASGDTDNLDIGYVYLTIFYKDYEGQTSPTESDKTVTATAKFDFAQSVNSAIPKESGKSPIDLTDDIVTTGDGLYVDSTESNRYIYRGTAPNNYMTFNGEEAGWRIVSIESDGTMKIVRKSNVVSMAWDANNTRSSSTSTYCTYPANGCNAWAATSNLVGAPAEFTLYNPNGNSITDSTTYSGTVTQDASLNTWLKNAYYDNTSGNTNYLGEDKKYIEYHNFYVGTPGDFQDTESIAVDSEQEKSYVWLGYVGLIQVTDYLKASTDSNCISISASRQSGSPCGNGNYLKPDSGIYWTISPFVFSNRSTVWTVSNNGNINRNGAGYSDEVRPAIYLSSSINLKGEGTLNSPYYIDD